MLNRKKYLPFLTLIIILSSCIKENSTNTYATLVNSTSHKISIWFYKSGKLTDKDSLVISPNSQFQFGQSFERGLSNGPGFGSDYFGSANDSMIVVFDNNYKIAHYYSSTPQLLRSKHYLYTSIRNIGNVYSYVLKNEHTSKHQWNNYHTYTFTEQDYLDAKP